MEAALSNAELLAYISIFRSRENGRRGLEGQPSDQWVRTSARANRGPSGCGTARSSARRRRDRYASSRRRTSFHATTINFKFAQVGKNRFGLRQDPAGGPGHQGAYIPWFDAPSGKVQRMSAFVLASTDPPEAVLERVNRYTHSDRFKPMDGRSTFTSHWHVRLAMNELNGQPAGPEAAKVFKAMNVNLVHLAEFHGDGNPADPGPKRLPNSRRCSTSAASIPTKASSSFQAKKANAQLNTPAPAGTHAGHWIYLFPKPVYLTLVRGEACRSGRNRALRHGLSRRQRGGHGGISNGKKRSHGPLPRIKRRSLVPTFTRRRTGTKTTSGWAARGRRCPETFRSRAWESACSICWTI